MVSEAISASDTIDANLYNAYKSLLKENIISAKAMATLGAWLKDIKAAKAISRS